MATDRATTADQLLAGRFHVGKTIGHGGMGKVCRGRDTELHRDVAIKLLAGPIAHDEAAQDLLRRETRETRGLRHPNIVSVYDFHRDEGEPPFISMELVEGESMAARRLKQPGSVFTWRQLRPLWSQLLAALTHAHDQGTIHRDLKPSNILIDEDDCLKLADFGISASTRDTLARHTRMVRQTGTFAYMSPQQLLGEDATVQDDIWSLGITLFELLTGHPPFHSGDISYQVLHQDPPPLEASERIPAHVVAAVRECLQKDRADRPRSVADLAALLEPSPHAPGPRFRARLPEMRRALFPAIGIISLILAGHALWPSAQDPASETREELAMSSPAGPRGIQDVLSDQPRAVRFSAVRDAGAATRDSPGRLLDLFSGNWPSATSRWKWDDGIIRGKFAPAEPGLQREHGLWFPELNSRNFELGIAWRLNRPANAFPAFTIWHRAETNFTPQSAFLDYCTQGFHLSPHADDLPQLYHRNESPPKIGNYTLEYRRESFSEAALAGEDKVGIREMIKLLREAAFTRQGGSWMVIRADETEAIAFINGLEIIRHRLDKLRTNYRRGTAPAMMIEAMRNRAGSVAINVRMPAGESPLDLQIGMMLYRELR